jgi:hypothetical protein
MAGVRRWCRDLADRDLRGRVRAVPVLNLPAFRSRAPFIVPEDCKIAELMGDLVAAELRKRARVYRQQLQPVVTVTVGAEIMDDVFVRLRRRPKPS